VSTTVAVSHLDWQRVIPATQSTGFDIKRTPFGVQLVLNDLHKLSTYRTRELKHVLSLIIMICQAAQKHNSSMCICVQRVTLIHIHDGTARRTQFNVSERT